MTAQSTVFCCSGEDNVVGNMKLARGESRSELCWEHVAYDRAFSCFVPWALMTTMCVRQRYNPVGPALILIEKVSYTGPTV